MEKHSIYIMLSQTGTTFSRLIRFYTKEPYAHVSLSLDKDLNEMYSFARKGIYNPFNSGFVHEDVEKGIFGKKKETNCIIYELKITEKQWQNLLEELDRFKSEEERYHYNFLGILGVIFNIPITFEFAYFCSQFVATILKRSEVEIINRQAGLARAGDFRQSPHLMPIYSGRLAEYRETLHTS